MYELKQKSSLPFDAVSVFIVVYALIFPFYRITDYVIAGGVSVIIFFVVAKLTTKRVVLSENIEKTNTPVDNVIDKGLKTVHEISGIADKIEDKAVKDDVKEIMQTAVSIFEYVSSNTAQIREINTFMEYYLPMTKKLVDAFEEFEETRVKTDALTETMEKTKETLKTVKAAYEKQLGALYDNKTLDVMTDIKVLERTLSEEGLK